MSRRRVIRRSALAALAVGATLPIFAGVATASSPSPHGAPAMPANVALTSGNKALKVAWTESSAGTITYRATATAPGNASHFCVTKTLTCTIASLVNGVVYDVSVTAVDHGGSSGPSGPVSAVVGVPGAPLSAHGVADVAAATITWAPPKASGVSKVLGYTATASPGGFSCSTSRTALSNPARTCEIAGLTTGVTYSITVTATNAFGNGVPSAPTSVNPN